MAGFPNSISFPWRKRAIIPSRIPILSTYKLCVSPLKARRFSTLHRRRSLNYHNIGHCLGEGALFPKRKLYTYIRKTRVCIILSPFWRANERAYAFTLSKDTCRMYNMLSHGNVYCRLFISICQLIELEGFDRIKKVLECWTHGSFERIPKPIWEYIYIFIIIIFFY